MSASQFLKMMVVLATGITGVVGFGLQILIENVIMERGLGWKKGEVELLFRELPPGRGCLLRGGPGDPCGRPFRTDSAVSPVLTPRASLLIGLVQGLCLPFRGFSRSGATISTALFCGVSRPLAEDFSFALAVVLTPPVIAAESYRLLKKGRWSSRRFAKPLLGPGLVGNGPPLSSPACSPCDCCPPHWNRPLALLASTAWSPSLVPVWLCVCQVGNFFRAHCSPEVDFSDPTFFHRLRHRASV